jgi:hypothetical protein
LFTITSSNPQPTKAGGRYRKYFERPHRSPHQAAALATCLVVTLKRFHTLISAILNHQRRKRLLIEIIEIEAIAEPDRLRHLSVCDSEAKPLSLVTASLCARAARSASTTEEPVRDPLANLVLARKNLFQLL